jgi:flagellar motor switch protein FliN/FliY
VPESWAESLAHVLESLTGVRPGVSVRLLEGPACTAETCLQPDALWWEQPLSLEGRPAVWVGVPAPAWRQIALRVMQAGGLDGAAETDLRNTFLEVLGQSLGGLVSSLGNRLGQEVRAEAGHEILDPPQADACAEVELRLEDSRLPAFSVVLADGLAQALESSAPEPPLAVVGPVDPASEASKPARTLDLLMEVELPVAISFGRAELPLKDVLKLTTGSIVELNRAVDEPVELIVNNCVIARGEVVVVDGNYGVRIRHIISPQERLRTLK